VKTAYNLADGHMQKVKHILDSLETKLNTPGHI
jgi:hypothetical protein